MIKTNKHCPECGAEVLREIDTDNTHIAFVCSSGGCPWANGDPDMWNYAGDFADWMEPSLHKSRAAMGRLPADRRAALENDALFFAQPKEEPGDE